MPSAVKMRPFESTPGGGDALRPLMSTHLQVASATKLTGTRPTERTIRLSFLLVWIICEENGIKFKQDIGKYQFDANNIFGFLMITPLSDLTEKIHAPYTKRTKYLHHYSDVT